MNVFSLFSGIGGLDLAAEWAGMQVVAQCEIDPWCRKLLARHWPKVPCFEDVRSLDFERLRAMRIDLVCGGYPCQPFSSAGKGLAEKDPRHLWPYVRGVLAALRPTWFVGENVRGHVARGLDAVLDDLESLGYTAWPHLISAQGVGAPHKRERVIIVARLVADTDGERQQQLAVAGGQVWLGAEDRRDALSHAHRTGREEQHAAAQPARARQHPRLPDPPRHRGWTVEPAVGRVAHGIPARLDRLKGLGNAVVPEAAFPFFDAIARIEMMQ